MYRNPEVSAQSPNVSRKVLQGCPALREALERRPEVQMAQPDYLEPREGWRTDGTVYAWDCDGAKVLIAIQ